MYENYSKSADKCMAAAPSAAGSLHMRHAGTAIITLVLLFVAIKSGMWETSTKREPATFE